MCTLVPKVLSTWETEPLASTYIPLGRVFVIWKPSDRSQPCTAVTEDLAGAYRVSNSALVSHFP